MATIGRRTAVQMALAIGGLAGCGIFKDRFPRFATRDFRDAQWMSRNALEGPQWEHEVWDVIAGAADHDLASVGEPIDRLVRGTRSAVAALYAHEMAGTRAKVKVGASRHVKLSVVTPPTRPAGLPDLAAIERAFALLALAEDEVSTHMATGKILDRYYGSCVDVLAMRREGKPSFDLPRGVSQERYSNMLHALVARLQSDHRAVDGALVAMSTMRIAVASMDVDRGGTAANALAVLDALQRDRDEARQLAQRTAKWPLDAAREPQLVERGKRVYDETIRSSPFMAWQNGSGDARNGARFGQSLLAVPAMFSAVYAQTMKVDVHAELVDAFADADLLRLVELLVAVAPVDSRIKDALAEGVRLTRAVAQNGVGALGAAASDAGQRATRRALVLVAPERTTALAQRLGVDRAIPLQ